MEDKESLPLAVIALQYLNAVDSVANRYATPYFPGIARPAQEIYLFTVVQDGRRQEVYGVPTSLQSRPVDRDSSGTDLIVFDPTSSSPEASARMAMLSNLDGGVRTNFYPDLALQTNGNSTDFFKRHLGGLPEINLQNDQQSATVTTGSGAEVTISRIRDPKLNQAINDATRARRIV